MINFEKIKSMSIGEVSGVKPKKLQKRLKLC